MVYQGLFFQDQIVGNEINTNTKYTRQESDSVQEGKNTKIFIVCW